MFFKTILVASDKDLYNSPETLLKIHIICLIMPVGINTVAVCIHMYMDLVDSVDISIHANISYETWSTLNRVMKRCWCRWWAHAILCPLHTHFFWWTQHPCALFFRLSSAKYLRQVLTKYKHHVYITKIDTMRSLAIPRNR